MKYVELPWKQFISRLKRTYGRKGAAEPARWDYLYDGYDYFLYVDGDIRVQGDLYLDSDWQRKGLVNEFFESHANTFGATDKEILVPSAWMPSENWGGILIDGDLFVEGDILNSDDDWGIMLFVTGMVKANRILAGGSNIRLNSVQLDEELFAFYNRGSVTIENLKARFVVSREHFTELNHVQAQAVFDSWETEDLAVRNLLTSEKMVDWMENNGINPKIYGF